MNDYFSMSKEALLTEQAVLQERYNRFKAQGLMLDMSRGKPGPEQLDISMEMLKIDAYKTEDGIDARNYGNPEGIPEARRLFAEILGLKEQEIIVGGNSSLALMYTMVDLGWRVGFPEFDKPWKDCPNRKFLCPSPGYDRHFRITEMFGFELVTVPMTPDGPDMDEVERLIQDEDVKGMWCVPVYSNPDGYVYSAETVKRLAEMKPAAKNFRILWDNAYAVHHLTDEALSCPNILEACRAAGCEDRPLLFSSTSKITFSGAGISAVGGSNVNVKAALDFMFPMTIGADKMNQLRHVQYLRQQGGVAEHMKRHAAIIKPKFEIVLDTLHRELDACGAIARWTEPKGGYFVSLFVPEGCAKRVVDLCRTAGVILTGAGAAYPYGKDPEDSHIRIAPTYPPLEELKLAAEVLCIAVRLASIEKLLAC